MTAYTPPVSDMMFVLNHVIGFRNLPKSADLDEATMQAVLEEAAKLASDVLAPLDEVGDRQGAKLANGTVTTSPGFKDAYAQYVASGWNGVPFNPAHGGQGLPWAFAFAVQEMWQGANMAFGLCPMLTQAAVEAIEVHGTQEQKDLYLAKLVSGAWTGTMNLTEPQAGTDLGEIRTKAEKQPDGTYLITGQKIFITYGEHDFTDNIIHMVLARVAGGPDGIKGLALFVMPKFMPDGTRNDVKCTGLEHKLGIHGSPTCTMQYGDEGGAHATIVGKEGEGLKLMFTMMNNARLSVGLQGVAIAERAFQQALTYARDRVQGAQDGKRVAIIEHPDVRRMLLSMKSKVEAGRAMAYAAALAMDMAHEGDADAKARADLLTPIVKAWCTDMAVEVTSTNIQVHGGMGFIEETGAARLYRNARILPIYEGTNGVQAGDLFARKVVLDKGKAAKALFDEIDEAIRQLAGDSSLAELRAALGASLKQVRQATDFLIQEDAAGRRKEAAAVSVPYLKAFGHLTGGLMMAKSAMAAAELAKQGGDPAFCNAKRLTALFYAAHILPETESCAAIVLKGGQSVTAFEPKMF